MTTSALSMGTSMKAFWVCVAVGACSVAAAAVLTVAPFHEDAAQPTIDQYVASIESNDVVGACRHASDAAAHYVQTGNAAVGEGWQSIAQAICSTGLDFAHAGS